jgi:hypothetical protein
MIALVRNYGGKVLAAFGLVSIADDVTSGTEKGNIILISVVGVIALLLFRGR